MDDPMTDKYIINEVIGAPITCENYFHIFPVDSPWSHAQTGFGFIHPPVSVEYKNKWALAEVSPLWGFPDFIPIGQQGSLLHVYETEIYAKTSCLIWKERFEEFQKEE